MWFKNLQLYRLPKNYDLTALQLEQFLAPYAFGPTGHDMQSSGWVPAMEDGLLAHAVQEQFLLKLQFEKKLLPTSVINQVAKLKASETAELQGFSPGRKQMREIKDQVTDELLPRAFSVQSSINVWIDPVNGWLAIDTASTTKADDVVRFLFKAIDKFPLQALRVNQSPVFCMTNWLSENDPPAGFTIDQDTELSSTGEGKGKVRYVRQSMDFNDAQRHIASGKQCTRLAMTWADRISFVLTESLTIKRVTALNVLKESENPADTDTERFDADFLLMSGELNSMLNDLVFALGGEVIEQSDWVQETAKKKQETK
jgi:recombination associated protein RdgC